MFPRLLKLPQNRSFILLGARNTGKSTLISQQFNKEHTLWLDLLEPAQEDRFSRNPGELNSLVAALPPSVTHVVVDEVQKVPKLLDVAQGIIDKTDKLMVLTGSSARKLKGGGANLLAGRAFMYHLFPFSYLELGGAFVLADALSWGMLPSISHFSNNEDKLRFLQSYVFTYLKEEIWAEQLIKKLDPFRRFLEVAAQCNGKIINYATIARDVGADDKTVQGYFSILEDTLIGFLLDPFQHSFRKRLCLKPKFYFFDVGVVRALARMLSVPLVASTSYYGDLFESFIIGECLKLASYFYPEFRFSYLKTKDDAEIDLVVERPGLPLLFIKIKSSSCIRTEDLAVFSGLIADVGVCEAVCFSNDPYPKQIGKITVLPWAEGIRRFFSS